MNSRKCQNCDIDVHRASYAKHLRSTKHWGNEKQNEWFIPEWLFKEPIENKIEIIYNPKPLKRIARENFKVDDKQIYKEIAEKDD